MQINIKLSKNFTTQWNKLQAEYGEEIARINGFDDNQLSYTDFIDNFIDEKVVADASIDGNSNVSHKDIVTLEKEMPKQTGVLLPQTLALYLDYLSKDGALARLIRESAHLDKDALLHLLIEKTADYGLSQEQCEKLIAKYHIK